MELIFTYDNFDQIMKVCKSFVTTTDTRAMLTQIHLEVSDPNVVTVTALSNCKMVTFRVPCDASKCPIGGEINIPLTKPLGKKAVAVYVSDTKKEIIVKSAMGTSIYPKMCGDFPNTEKNWYEDTPETRIYFNPKLLKTALEAFDDECVSIESYGEMRGYIIRSVDKKALVLPVNPERGKKIIKEEW